MEKRNKLSNMIAETKSITHYFIALPKAEVMEALESIKRHTTNFFMVYSSNMVELLGDRAVFLNYDRTQVDEILGSIFSENTPLGLSVIEKQLLSDIFAYFAVIPNEKLGQATKP